MSDQNNPKRPYNWDGSEGEFISREEAKAGVADYKASKSYDANGHKKAHYFGGEKIAKILKIDGAVGIRAYYAKCQGDDPKRRVKKGDADLYLIPVDKDGNDIFTDNDGNSAVLDVNWPCPPWCSGGNGLG